MGLLTLFHVVAILVAFVEPQLADDCPPLYKRYSEEHTFCKPPNPKCKILKSSVTQDDIKVIVKEHNELRSKLATGKEQDLPSAGDMLQMVWDEELAAVAQKHASQCVFGHDCNNCRRVQNFGVGQNLYTDERSEPNWAAAIKRWYDEVKDFNKKAIDSFIPPPKKPTYGHFSQVVWANSWRVGCGYAQYEESGARKQLYTCNYGPAGNTRSKSMYKQGPQCSACPENSCCDKTCSGAADFPGLCKITDDKAPTYKPQGSYIFYCDFQNQPDCQSSVTGQNKWVTYSTLSGNYLGIVLNGGEESTITFSKSIKPSTNSFCIATNYRKGPNVAGQEESNKALETFITDSGFGTNYALKGNDGEIRHLFSEFGMNLGWSMATQFKLTFSVPPGKPPQFFEMQKLYAKEGRCKF